MNPFQNENIFSLRAHIKLLHPGYRPWRKDQTSAAFFILRDQSIFLNIFESAFNYKSYNSWRKLNQN